MIHSSHRDRKAKAMAEVLALIAETQPLFESRQPQAHRESQDWQLESATEFILALEKYYAGRARQMKRKNH